MHAARRRADIEWGIAAGVTVLAAAWWLREPSLRYLVLAALATAACGVLAWRLPARRRARELAVAGTATLFLAAAASAQRELWRVDHDWPAYQTDAVRVSARALRTALVQTTRALEAMAARSLDAPTDPASAFQYLATELGGAGEQGAVLYRGERPWAWAGRIRSPTDTLVAPLGAAVSPFYLTLYAVATRGPDRAVAMALVHATPPADSLASALDRRITGHGTVQRFEFEVGATDTSAPGTFVFSANGRPLFTARPVPMPREEARVHVLEHAREVGALALSVLLVCFVAAVWRSALLRARFAALAAVLACVWLVPLNELSNVTRLFDPSLYFAPLGGPFTASAGALGLTSGVLLLGLLALLRARLRAARWAATLAVLVIAGLGPFLLRDLARGIVLPSRGVTIGLWLGWQVTLFLAAVSLVLAGASAGRAALGARRGLPIWMGPLIAGIAAIIGPVVAFGAGRWPGWYPALWIVAIGALALTRRSRGAVLAAATVAALGATTLVWGTTVRKRVLLADQDMARLERVDDAALALLERFAAQLASERAPPDRASLLARYVASDLSAAGYPVELSVWDAGDVLRARLGMAALDAGADDVTSAVHEARAEQRVVVHQRPGSPGVRLVAAAPHGDGRVTTIVVEPRTRLIPDDPFAALIGVAAAPSTDAPYLVTLIDVDSASLRSGHTGAWRREGNELQTDWLVRTADGVRRAHVTVEMRALDVLIQRGTLVLLLDLLLVGGLWMVSAIADGGFGRWLRARRAQWARSYRMRLTLSLFTFFVVPAVVFAVWSYRQLREDDRRSRELLVRETLRAVASAGDDASTLEREGERLETPLILYRGGALALTSDPLYDLMAPIGRFLRPEIQLRLGLSGEVAASHVEQVGGTQALFGYRAAVGSGGERVVLAAPAPMTEETLDRRRRDLGILVLFATAIGAAAALWLSGVAARQFGRPIGALRQAALAIAAGEREPPLASVVPLAEFVPVFSAFRRMARDLNESRHALEEAQRRIAAILRNVASGVVAVDGTAAVTLANPRADSLLGAPLPPGTLLASAAPPVVAREVVAFLRGGADDHEFETEHGGRRLHGRLTRLVRSVGAVLTLDDVTELARAQRVLAWGEMARQVAHEIKNPLTPIRLGVQHLKRARADARVDFDRVLDQNVTRILAEIDRLDEIARAFSRYGTAPGDAPGGEPTDVAAIVRDVVALEMLGEGAIRWTVAGADEPALALARGDELREVLLNVFENARLADAKHVAAAVERRDGRVIVVVRDDGHGIHASVLPRIFEPHFSTRTSGSGLGLAISRRLIEGWGGTIEVDSAPGKGTRIRIGLVGMGGGE